MLRSGETKFVIDIIDMIVNGCFRNEKLFGNYFVTGSAYEKLNYLYFPVAKGCFV